MFQLFRDHQLNIMLLLCGACAVMILLLVNTRFLARKRKMVLILMESLAFLLLWFDRMAYLYSGDTSFTGYIMVRVSNFAVFFLTSMVVFGFNLYVEDLITSGDENAVIPLRLKITKYVAIGGMLLSIVSAFTGLYYYFDKTNVYHRGDGFLVAYIVPIACPIIQYTVIRGIKGKVSKLIYISLVLYLFVPIACGILQIFTYGISIVNMSMVIVSISLYIFAYHDINDTVEKAHKVEKAQFNEERKNMKKLFDQTATAFVTAIEKKDTFSKGHSLKVAEYARRIAELSGLSESDCEKTYYAALLHDVGMIGIPDSVIERNEAPDEAAREIYKKKPIISKEILSNISEYPFLAKGAYYSHERYDGSGYPEGLKGKSIPDIARIIAVADAYVTQTSAKRYREPHPDFVVRENFVKGAGSDYDPEYAECMLKIIDTEVSAVEAQVETSLECGEYRKSFTSGIVVEEMYLDIDFECSSEGYEDKKYNAPSIILFDSFDKRIHTEEVMIEEYRYLEYGELWFNGNSVTTGARKIKEDYIRDTDEVCDGHYHIRAGRYEDHVKLEMISPYGKKIVTVALLGGSKAVYISITGENCSIKDINIGYTKDRVLEGDIERIEEEVSYIDRLESDIKNVQVDRTRSAYTDGVRIKDRLRILFHTMSLPGANLVWHCPYIVLYTSEDGQVGG
ncbi:MAG: HD domain-containing protein, partial [Lachnospiraceae bacterium]|nr:HD domain-containing protein [Lachnospiraceae bacterium]